LNFSVT